MTTPKWQWRVPVRIEDVPETGKHLEVSADAEVRAALAALAGVLEITRLDAAIDVTRYRNGLRAVGRLLATVSQSCVVTLEPVETRVDEPFDVAFAPASAGDASPGDEGDRDDPPELLINGIADLGGVMTEFLLLGIDAYPRIPGAVFVPPAEAGDDSGPFGVLAKLKNP